MDEHDPKLGLLIVRLYLFTVVDFNGAFSNYFFIQTLTSITFKFVQEENHILFLLRCCCGGGLCLFVQKIMNERMLCCPCHLIFAKFHLWMATKNRKPMLFDANVWTTIRMRCIQYETSSNEKNR
ncbi:hypothetical protein BLOT_008612 [Blomia tropicalis]|nr:hypothetical protein BLOT_008612 [Blomia tropicalis]